MPWGETPTGVFGTFGMFVFEVDAFAPVAKLTLVAEPDVVLVVLVVAAYLDAS